MHIRCAHWLLILALLVSVGGHWALLQTAAWTGMFVSHTQQGSLVEALSKTFDGEHPCALCKAVKRGHEEQQKQDSEAPEKLKKMALYAELAEASFFPDPLLDLGFHAPSPDLGRQKDMPFLPPPRGV